MASCGFDMVGYVPYQNHICMAHRLPISYPYMSHTTQLGKGAALLPENRNFFGKWQLILFCLNLLDNERQLSYYRKFIEGKKCCVCEISNLNQLTVVKRLMCNKLCKIYHVISDFIVERILYASKQTTRMEIFE